MMGYQEEKRLEKQVGGTAAEHRIATVQSVSGGKAVLLFDGEDAASTKPYKTNADVTFAAGDRVLCARVSGSYVVMLRL